MTFTAHISYKAETDAKWQFIVMSNERKTLRGARADALATFAMLSPAQPRLFARIVSENGRGVRKVVETLEIPG